MVSVYRNEIRTVEVGNTDIHARGDPGSERLYGDRQRSEAENKVIIRRSAESEVTAWR